MKKLIFIISLVYLHAPIFAMQKALPVSPLQQKLEQNLRYPVHRAESKMHVAFTAPLESNPPINIYAYLEKSTGFVEIVSRKMFDGPRRWELIRTSYEKYPQETYNALQALYEKQQEEKKVNS